MKLPKNIENGKLNLSFDSDFLSLWDEPEGCFQIKLTEEQKRNISNRYIAHCVLRKLGKTTGRNTL